MSMRSSQRDQKSVNQNKATFVHETNEQMTLTKKALKTLGPEEKMSQAQKDAIKSKVQKIINECLHEVSDTEQAK